MIKEIRIKNIYGITNEQTFSFELKDLKETQIGMHRGVVRSENSSNLKIMLTPTLIAQNASGKTSCLRAIKSFGNIESIDEIFETIFKAYYNIISAMKKEIHFFSNFLRHQSGLDNAYGIDNGDEATKRYMLDIFHTIPEIRYEFRSSRRAENALNTGGIITSAKRYLIDILKRGSRSSFRGIQLPKAKDEPSEFSISNTNGDSKVIKIGNAIQFNEQKMSLEEFENIEIDKIKTFNIFASSADNEKMENIVNFLQGGINLDELKINFLSIEKVNRAGDKYTRDEIRESRSIRNKIFYIDDSEIRSRIIEGNKIRFKETSNIDRLFSDLTKYYPFDFINKTLCAIDADVSHIEVFENESTSRIKRKNRGSFKPTVSLSFGTLKLFILLDELAKAIESGGTLLIDEIENGLNMSLIKLFMEVVKSEKFNKNSSQVILTTHNPQIINRTLISPYNAFMYLKSINSFKNASNLHGLVNRTEDLQKIFLSKNYFNELFWDGVKDENGNEYMSPNTINNNNVSDLVDELEGE